jgi:hypothetical protein
MAIHDTWHFENAPQGVNLGVAAGGSAYNANTIYGQYTGNVGQIFTLGSANAQVTSDGFLTLPAVGGACGFLGVPLNLVQDWTNSTQYWIGFRTKLNSAYNNGFLLLIGSNTSNSSYTPLLTEAQLSAAGYSVVGVEHYLEIFIDRSALTFQVYCDGLLINSGAVSAAALNSGNGFVEFGCNVTGGATANGSRGFRDFYFLDVDSTYTTKLGPIRAKAATITAAVGSEWTANGAASVLAALNTAIGSGSMTPNAQAPLDKQALQLSLSSPVADAGSRIIGISPVLSFGSLSGSVANVAAGFQDGSNPLVSSGIFVQTNAGGAYNQKLPLVKTGPNGQTWTAAEINQAQYVLTPQ